MNSGLPSVRCVDHAREAGRKGVLGELQRDVALHGGFVERSAARSRGTIRATSRSSFNERNGCRDCADPTAARSR